MSKHEREHIDPQTERSLDDAARALREADALLITAGAGIGVDSGLPDFRGPTGFWKAYPPYRHLGLRFSDMANPQWFESDAAFAWGFYGHRLSLYRETTPHSGFDLLKRWAKDREAFVFTSNIDGQFQKAGFGEEAVYEVHGSIHWLQCTTPCHDTVWCADPVAVDVDETTFRAQGTLPTCPRCKATARPNVLMFGDWGFSSERSNNQEDRFDAWARDVLGRDLSLVVVEMGAGSAVPTVRMLGNRAAQSWGATLVRINPREPQGPSGCISLPLGAEAALTALAERL